MNLQSVFVFLILCLVHQICAQCDDGSVRLTGGPNKFEGRVEVCVDGSWGQVCAMGWTRTDAEVVCRQLGQSTNNSQPVLSDVYGGEAAPARITNAQCGGKEEQLTDCSIASLSGSDSCTAYVGPAGVICRDPECSNDRSVRLSEEQVVEVCFGGFRTGVCSSNWDDTDASVVCRQLSLGDHGVASSTASVFYRRGGAYDRVNCTNSNLTLSDCEHSVIGGVNPRDQCSTGQFAQVECKEAIPTTPFAPVTMPPAETTTPPATDSTTTSFKDTDSTTTDMEQNQPTSEGTTTGSLVEPGSPQSQSDSQLLAIVLGAVGGLIVVLLFGIIVLLIVVILGRQRRKYSMQYIDNNANGQAVMTTLQVTAKEDQLANSYSSQKGGSDPEHHLLNPLYLQNQQQMANSNPLPYASVVTPPSTADDSQVHEYATLDDFQPTVSQWPPKQPQEYSNPVATAVSSTQNNRTSGVPNVYSEPVLPHGSYKVGEDGIVTDLQGYASLDPTAHSYDYPLTSEGAKSGAEGMSTLPIPQPYETPFESSYEDASSTNISRSTTPAGSRRESPERKDKDTDSATNHTSTQAEERINPYTEPSPFPEDRTANGYEAPLSHDYATLEPPK